VVPLEEENNDTFTDCITQSSVTFLSFVTIMIHFFMVPASLVCPPTVIIILNTFIGLSCHSTPLAVHI